MKRAAKPQAPPEPGPSGAGLRYADQLAVLEARRRASDDLLLRKMMQLRDPMNPGDDPKG